MHHQIYSSLVAIFFIVQRMDMALSKLNSGGWAHICPEGSHLMDEGKNHCSYQERCCKVRKLFSSHNVLSSKEY
jgi:hypothetical protein